MKTMSGIFSPLECSVSPARQLRQWLAVAMLALMAGNASAQNQPAMMPYPPAPVGGKFVSWPTPLPAYFTNAPEVTRLVGDREQMEQYVAANPDSVYTPWLRNSLATGYRHSGRITLALNHWAGVWQQLKDATDPAARSEANHALAGQLELLTSLGRVESLYDLLKAAEGRTISDPADRERIEKAREGYVMMLRNPGLNYRCGTLALAEIARLQGKPATTINALIEEPSPSQGVSLSRLVQLSRQYDLGLVAVKRTDNTPLPVPCVVHWAQNHYGALLEYRADLGCYRAIFGEPNWISAPDVDAEASGYFLIPENQVRHHGRWFPMGNAPRFLGEATFTPFPTARTRVQSGPDQSQKKCPDCPDAKGMPVMVGDGTLCQRVSGG